MMMNKLTTCFSSAVLLAALALKGNIYVLPGKDTEIASFSDNRFKNFMLYFILWVLCLLYVIFMKYVVYYLIAIKFGL